jgi:hypothetical protein
MHTMHARHTSRVDRTRLATPTAIPAVAPRRHRVLARVAQAASLAASLVIAAAAAPSPASAQPRAAAQLSLVPRSSYVLTASELRPGDTRSLLSLLATRWPTLVWGTTRNATSRMSPAGLGSGGQDRFGVYDIYGSFLGGSEYLEAVYPSNVTEVRRLTEVEEFAAFGRSHPAGAIVLTWALPSRG